MKMTTSSLVSSTIAVALLLIGAWAGTSDAVHLPLRSMHIGIATVFVLLLPLMLYVHIQRFFVRGAFDWIAWTHFVLFAVLIFIAIRMLRRWYVVADSGAADSHRHSDHFSSAVRSELTWEGKAVDENALMTYMSEHPGGEANIQKVLKEEHRGKDLHNIWKAEGVGWHINHPTVREKVKTMLA